MDLREILAGVAALEYNFRHPDGRDQAAQQHLESAREELSEWVPPGYRVRVSGAAVNIPEWPWIAILDPDVTTTAQRGQYVVYLYSEDFTRVYLTVNQGVTAHEGAARADGKGRGANLRALDALNRESDAVRERLPEGVRATTTRTIDLGRHEFLPDGYAAGTVAALEYATAELPAAEVLETDLLRFLEIYDSAVQIKRALTLEDPKEFNTPSPSLRTPAESALEFKPKDSSDYVVNVPARSEQRARRHEELVKDFGGYAAERGWTPATNVHPRDLILRRDGQREVLCEVKTVGPNSELAVRAVIGQVFTYRHMCYPPPRDDLQLLGVYTGPIGGAFVELSTELGIMSVWREGKNWRGCPQAVELGLADS